MGAAMRACNMVMRISAWMCGVFICVTPTYFGQSSAFADDVAADAGAHNAAALHYNPCLHDTDLSPLHNENTHPCAAVIERIRISMHLATPAASTSAPLTPQTINPHRIKLMPAKGAGMAPN